MFGHVGSFVTGEALSLAHTAAGIHHCTLHATALHLHTAPTIVATLHAATNTPHTSINRKLHRTHIPHTHRIPPSSLRILRQYIHGSHPPILTVHFHTRRCIIRSVPQFHLHIQRTTVRFYKSMGGIAIVRCGVRVPRSSLDGAGSLGGGFPPFLGGVSSSHHVGAGTLRESTIHVEGAWIFVDGLCLAREVGLVIGDLAAEVDGGWLIVLLFPGAAGLT
mmetsp:Transcript_27942/g.59596  ORF Transcript_27942/g.59596 Transcript_27942/m.59596 type:complete len:220 (-) Transcript_27942:355-1014(-)